MCMFLLLNYIVQHIINCFLYFKWHWQRNFLHIMMRWTNSYVSGLYQYIRLIFGIKASQNVDPSEQTLEISSELFHLLQTRKDNPQDRLYGLTHAKQLLAECKEFEMLAYITNGKGYNLIQVAVMSVDEDFVSILVDEGWNLNNGNCSLPLHLACKIGNRPLVELLLKHGASAMQKSGMCYPGYHVPVQHVPSRFHFLETDIYACDASHELPVMYAIQVGLLQDFCLCSFTFQLPHFLYISYMMLFLFNG